MTAVGLEPTPLQTDALSQHLRPLGQTVLGGLGSGEGLDLPNSAKSHRVGDEE